ncbi:helix-turn-helix domain-containing protein [Sinanaerobacter sp. ZZT-01]|uniref:helix-turn-helix domain-containing protein n=1 Tax=Sinanaerobacter sp. ZZT-01 TaxID=3111540 RepID=UPI002D79B0FE|nr:helix-turn-helix domain-containing protein [Sinanaerobacter sp. ZZT-01]WRR94168.1 helix-turn-helix domain-containing protein [Sinanaerobacter sp. ZZT-01]
MKEKEIVNVLRVEGIMAQGYGLSPKIIMRDKRLTLEAKSIYCYLASFAGNGNQAFPSRDIMLDELQMSKTRYYKHLKYLIDMDYIRVERLKEKGNIFGKNIYTIVSLPDPQVQEEQQESTLKESNPTLTQKSSREQKESSYVKPRKNNIAHLKVKGKSSVQELRERLEIDRLKKSDTQHSNLIEEIFMAIEDMDSSEQITIAGAVKKKDAIQELLNRLTPDHIRLVTHNVSANKKGFVNKKAYLQTCIANSIFDINNKKREAENLIEKKKQEEEREKEAATKHKKQVQELYNTYPALKEMDNQLISLSKEMSKAILSGNEVTHKKLKTTHSELKTKRELFVKKNGLEGCI